MPARFPTFVYTLRLAQPMPSRARRQRGSRSWVQARSVPRCSLTLPATRFRAGRTLGRAGEQLRVAPPRLEWTRRGACSTAQAHLCQPEAVEADSQGITQTSRYGSGPATTYWWRCRMTLGEAAVIHGEAAGRPWRGRRRQPGRGELHPRGLLLGHRIPTTLPVPPSQTAPSQTASLAAVRAAAAAAHGLHPQQARTLHPREPAPERRAVSVAMAGQRPHARTGGHRARHGWSIFHPACRRPPDPRSGIGGPRPRRSIRWDRRTVTPWRTLWHWPAHYAAWTSAGWRWRPTATAPRPRRPLGQQCHSWGPASAERRSYSGE